MSDHLRFTHDEYRSLCQACRSLCSSSSYSAFQRSLTNILRCFDLPLAQRVAGLNKRQVRTLREHLEDHHELQGAIPRCSDKVEPRCELSLREWWAVAQACALIWLHDDCPQSFKGRLVGEVTEVEPALAAKLNQLDEDQVATLYRRLKSGKRWSA